MKSNYAVMVTVEDNDGMLAQAIVVEEGNRQSGVDVQLGLGVEPLALAGLFACCVHAAAKVAEVPEKLLAEQLSILEQFNSLMKVRLLEKKQKKPRRKAKASIEHTSRPNVDDIPF